MTRRRGRLLSCFGVGFLLVSSNVIERAGRVKRVATGEAERSEEEEDVGARSAQAQPAIKIVVDVDVKR